MPITSQQKTKSQKSSIIYHQKTQTSHPSSIFIQNYLLLPWHILRLEPRVFTTTSEGEDVGAELAGGRMVVEPTPLKNMIVKMGIFPNFRGENKQCLKPPPRNLFVSTSQHLGFKYLVDDINPLGLMLLK